MDKAIHNGLHCIYTRGLFLDLSSVFTTQPSQESSTMNWPSSLGQPVNVTGSQTSWHTGGSKWGWLNSALTHTHLYCNAEVCRGYAGYFPRPRCWWSVQTEGWFNCCPHFLPPKASSCLPQGREGHMTERQCSGWERVGHSCCNTVLLTWNATEVGVWGLRRLCHPAQ